MLCRECGSEQRWGLSYWWFPTAFIGSPNSLNEAWSFLLLRLFFLLVSPVVVLGHNYPLVLLYQNNTPTQEGGRALGDFPHTGWATRFSVVVGVFCQHDTSRFFQFRQATKAV